MMLDTIVKAAENFCIHQIRSPHDVAEQISNLRTLIAYIDTTSDTSVQHRVYIACDEPLMQQIAEIFLGEDESDEATLIDMALETTNMIVGSAKVLASEEADLHFNISTPNFVKIDTFDVEYDTHKTILVNDQTMVIAIKEL